MTDGIDQPAQPGRDATSVDMKGAGLQPNDRRGRHFTDTVRIRAGHQASPQSDMPGGANKIEFVGPSFPQRELALDSGRIGADAVVGRDSAQRS